MPGGNCDELESHWVARNRQEAGIAALVAIARDTGSPLGESPPREAALLSPTRPQPAVAQVAGALASGTERNHTGWFSRQLISLRTPHPRLGARLVRFSLVGVSGLAVNLLALVIMLRGHVGDIWPGGQIVALIIASQIAVGWNFSHTERWVFSVGSRGWATRLLVFWLVSCSSLLTEMLYAFRVYSPLSVAPRLLSLNLLLVLSAMGRFALYDRWLYHQPETSHDNERSWRAAFSAPRRPRTAWQYKYQPYVAGIVAVLLPLAPLMVQRSAADTNSRLLFTQPTLAQVNASIALAQQYLDGLYKPLPGGQAVESEFYGLPLRVYFPADHRWVLLGEGHAGQCITGCTSTTSILADSNESTTEAETVSFADPTIHSAFLVHVSVNWVASSGRFAISVSQVKFTGPATSAQLWLDDDFLDSFRAGNYASPVTRIFPDSDRAVLRSFRYTIRHGTQEAYMYSRARADAGHASALSAFLRSNGYAPGVDLRASIFGQGAQLPAAMPFDSTGADNAYPDCGHLPQPSPEAYPYGSKVCLVGIDAFLLAGRADPFLQAFQALQTLNKNDDPGQRYPLLVGLGLDGFTPNQTADHLQQLWDQLGYGIPECSLAGCDTQASGLRTFAFGAVESLLGYKFGQLDRRKYADAAADVAIVAQIGAGGVIDVPGGAFVRPGQSGAYPIFWNDQYELGSMSSASKAISNVLSMPEEYKGVIVSDGETTFDGWAFLTIYRCARFGVGCQEIPEAGTGSA